MVDNAKIIAVAERTAVINLLPVSFHVGDRVVHPQHGLGRVVNLKDESFEPGVTRQYYEILIQNGSTVWVPVDLTTSGLRTLAGRKDINHCRKVLTSSPAPLIADARMRQTMLAVRLRQGTIVAQCEVVRDLYAHGEHKSLIGTMAYFFRDALDVLAQEWAVVEDVPIGDAMQEINSLLEKSRRDLNAKKS